MSNVSAIVILNSRSGNGSKVDLVHKLRSMAAALDVTCDIVSARNPSHLIEAARKAAKSQAVTGKLEPQYDFDMICTSAMRVESRRMLRTVAFDGERVKMLAPIEFRVRQAALSIVVPRKREEIAV